MMKKRIALFLIVTLQFMPHITGKARRLSAYNYGSASVLPVCRYHSADCVILSREVFGSSKGTYDDFGGGRDKGEKHPLITASREFFEEAILALSLGWTLAEVQNYIDIAKTGNTTHIIVHARNVTYIINFDRYTKKFLNNFYKARKQAKDPVWKEKDRVALVKWETLRKAINNYKRNTGLQLEAQEIDPITLQPHTKTITLRPSFVKKVRSFFMNKPYQEGMDKKIRFYR